MSDKPPSHLPFVLVIVVTVISAMSFIWGLMNSDDTNKRDQKPFSCFIFTAQMNEVCKTKIRVINKNMKM